MGPIYGTLEPRILTLCHTESQPWLRLQGLHIQVAFLVTCMAEKQRQRRV